MSYGKVNKTTGERIPYAGNGSAGIDTTYTLSVGTGVDSQKIILTPSSGAPDKITVPFASEAGAVQYTTVTYAQWLDMTPEQKAAADYFIPDYPGTSGVIASRVLYDNATSHLSSNTVQGAVDELASSLEDKIDVSAIGSASGVASLNENGKVPISELPSYVDDVINGYLYNRAFYEDSSHTTEITPESGKIYIDVETNKTYRWSGTAYTEISESLALGETSSTAYAGNKGKANADAIAAIKDGSTIDSFSDVETALSTKQDGVGLSVVNGKLCITYSTT